MCVALKKAEGARACTTGHPPVTSSQQQGRPAARLFLLVLPQWSSVVVRPTRCSCEGHAILSDYALRISGGCEIYAAHPAQPLHHTIGVLHFGWAATMTSRILRISLHPPVTQTYTGEGFPQLERIYNCGASMPPLPEAPWSNRPLSTNLPKCGAGVLSPRTPAPADARTCGFVLGTI